MVNTEQQLQEEILNLRHIFIMGREKLVRFLYKAANEIDDHYKNVTITKVVTGSTATAGTIIGLVGLVLTPATGGLSAVMTIAGTALALTSETAYLGSSCVEYFLNKSYLDELDELSQADEENYFKLNNYLQERVEELRNGAFNNNASFRTKLNILTEVSSLNNLGCSIVRITRIASKASRAIQVFRVASTALSAVTLPLQIIDLGINGHALHKNERSKKANEFRELARELNVQMSNVTQYLMQRINQFEHDC